MPPTRTAEMTADCRDFLAMIDARAARARRAARFLPRHKRQAAIYNATFRNDIEAVAFFLAETLGRIPDFANPKGFTETARAQFLTHPNPMLSIGADKIAMRAYCDLFDLPIRPVPLIASFDNPDDLDLRDLPETCMVKVADGCKMNILHGPGLPLTPFAYRFFLWKYWHIDHWRRHAELHYRDIPKRILVEEALLPIRAIRETFIFCAMGEPYLVSRGALGSALENRLIPLVKTRAREHVPLADLAPAHEMAALLETARKLSAPFLHCRVDFMHIGDKTHIGEITMSPGGYYRPIAPELETLRRSLLDTDRLPDLAEEGRKIAARLGQPTETSFGHFAGDPRLSTAGQ